MTDLASLLEAPPPAVLTTHRLDGSSLLVGEKARTKPGAGDERSRDLPD
jgi:hypothetical protein